MDKLIKHKHVIAVIALTIGVFLLGSHPFSKGYLLELTLVSLVTLIAFAYKDRKTERSTVRSTPFIYLATLTILLLVAATGWFFSPFFFTLYLVALILAFEFNPPVSLGFVTVLVGLFTLNVGEVDVMYDFLIILSLLSVIPIAVYLRKEYLKLKQAEKEILVLKEKGELPSTVENILANKVHELGVNLRQPINDIKQISHYMRQKENANTFKKHQDRIIASAEEALRTIKKFEEQTTGKKLLSKMTK